MKVGDLIKVGGCLTDEPCPCFFCYQQSSRLGIVIKHVRGLNIHGSDEQWWHVQFDCGEWFVSCRDIALGHKGDIEVINESR